MYNIKDIIRVNQEVGEAGELRNESGLLFALSMAKKRKEWLYELAYLVRCIIVDHPFTDGNKRTAFMLCILYFDDKGKEFGREALLKAIREIAKKNITDIHKIMRLLLRC